MVRVINTLKAQWEEGNETGQTPLKSFPIKVNETWEAMSADFRGLQSCSCCQSQSQKRLFENHTITEGLQKE